MTANVSHTDIWAPHSLAHNWSSNDIMMHSARALRRSTSQLWKHYFISDPPTEESNNCPSLLCDSQSLLFLFLCFLFSSHHPLFVVCWKKINNRDNRGKSDGSECPLHLTRHWAGCGVESTDSVVLCPFCLTFLLLFIGCLFQRTVGFLCWKGIGSVVQSGEM